MAEADPVASHRPTPLDVDRRLRTRVTEAVIAQAGIRHEALNAFLRQQLGGDDIEAGALFSEPMIEGAAGYVSSGKTPADLAGTLLHPRLVDALTYGEPGDDYRFVHQAYGHQLEAWKQLIEVEQKSVLVSSGTGSGKTECFLVPMLDDLARESEMARATGGSGRLRGVRALMLYPLNALIASQQERLKRWTQPFGGDIRFALYNGLMQDKRKSVRDADENFVPEQVLYRTTLREDAPPILVTNSTMLEYMTIRREDRPILEASHGKLRWIVIDEAHSYIGSAAAEVALLLRRVMEAFGVEAGQVRFVATSATIGDKSDESKAELRRFLADLAGVPESQVAVVFGQDRKVSLDGPGLASDPIVQKLVRRLEEGPSSLAEMNFLTGANEGVDRLKTMAAVNGQSDGPLLPMRVHEFIRAVPGLWSCLDPACSGARPEGWPYGAILHEKFEHCPHCKAPPFELVSCRECGEPWLQAFDNRSALVPTPSPPDRDEFAAASARETDATEAEDDETDQSVPVSVDDLVYLATRPINSADLKSMTVDPRTGELPDARDAGISVQVSKQAGDRGCPHCHAAPQANGSQPIWPFRFGAPFLIQNATPIMLEGVAPHEPRDEELPADGRRLLSFTDSRQGTARFAANIETMAERGFVRAWVYHAVQKAAASTSLSDDERQQIAITLSALRQSNNPALDDMIQREQAKLEKGEPAAVLWRDAVRDLAAEPMVKKGIGAVWDKDRDERFASDHEALANFLLLRELSRRPRRANALETLGFAKLVFEPIERLRESALPELLRRKKCSLAEWRDFLYFLVDTVVRNHFVLDIARGDARWLLPRQAHLREIVGPGEAKRNRFDQAWPFIQTGISGSKSNAVLALEMALGLNSALAQDREDINDILGKAWDQLLPILSGSGTTYKLSLEKYAGISAVCDAWLCPVTHRVLPRLVFGRSPYSFRGAARASAAPVAIKLPQLPRMFPSNDAQRAELSAFVDCDPGIADLREKGVWGELHTRAATFAPYIRAEEHSAQQPPHRLRAFEAQFKLGRINLLACSTTMEMGVDIGSIEAVLNTNVPPSIANYRQRVGRAGRRGQGFSSSLTFARDTPLERETFRDPVEYLNRKLRAPKVKLDSARIVQRHVNALLLARWFQEADGQLTKTRAGDFFGYPQGLGLEPEENPPALKFAEWLRQPSTATATAEAISRLVRGTALDGVPALADETARLFEQARLDFERQWSALRDQARDLAPEARTSIEIMVKRMTREFLLRELTNSSLLPGHGFPTSVVPFITDCREVRARDRSSDDGGGETRHNRRYDYPSRNADVAIREYAPGAEVVVDGLVWTSAGVTLNWERPAHDEAAREIQSIRWSCQCLDCGENGFSRTMPGSCESCGSERLDSRRFLEPAGFRVDWSCEPHSQTDQVRYIEPRSARISAQNARWEPMLDPALGRLRATGAGMVFHHSLGMGGGYKVCLDCGRAADDDGGLNDHEALMPIKGERGRCPGNDKPFAITDPLALGHEVLTDVVEVQPANLDSLGAAWALTSALREALARHLGIETRELGLGVASRPSLLGGSTHSLFLYDQTSGGAGYAARLVDEFAMILRDARDVLACPRQCERGCSACVLVADLFAQQAMIDRRAALDFVEGLLAAIAEPEPADMAGPNAVLSAKVGDVLSRQMRAGATITLFAQDALDITALSNEPLRTVFASAKRAGSVVRLSLANSLFDTLDDAQRRGLRDTANRNAVELWLGNGLAGSNGAALIATIEQNLKLTGWYSRDVFAATLGESWGAGSEHPVVKIDMTAPILLQPIDSEALERTVKPGDRVRIVASDNGRPLRQFGIGLVKSVLQVELEATDLWKPGRLVSLQYTDRYLKAPLPALLMLQTLAALRDALAPKTSDTKLSIVTEPLRFDRNDPPARMIWNNWPNENDRADTIITLAERFRFACDYDDASAPHNRKLTLNYDDGTSAMVLFDQGFGPWRARNAQRHDFRAGPQAQAKAMFDMSGFVAAEDESYIAITRG
jgi:DEAD/DEAH box helicase domain-containing protein